MTMVDCVYQVSMGVLPTGSVAKLPPTECPAGP